MQRTARMRRFLPAAWLTIIALASVACADSTGPINLHGVNVWSKSDAVVIANFSSEPIYSFAIGRDLAAVTDWGPCVDATCGLLESGQIRSTPNSQFASSETSVIVYWWTAERTSAGERVAGPIQVAIVQLVR
jgi:hypothetical protein